MKPASYLAHLRAVGSAVLFSAIAPSSQSYTRFLFGTCKGNPDVSGFPPHAECKPGVERSSTDFYYATSIDAGPVD